MLQDLDKISLGSLARAINKQQEAEIRRSSDLRPKLALRVSLELDSARTPSDPLVINQPFNGFYVESATDSDVAVKIALGGSDKYSTDNFTTLGRNDAAYSPVELKGASLFWEAQSGKTMVLIFYVGVEYRPGSLVSEITGGVSIVDGDSLSSAKLSGAVATIACPAGAATQILDADADRKVIRLYIDGGAWIGDSSVSPGARGVFYPSGLIELNSQAAHYLYPSGASAVNVFGNDYR